MIRKHLQLRQQTSPAVIALLNRAEGLSVYQYAHGLRESHEAVPVGDTSNKVGELMIKGYGFNGLDIKGENINLVRLDGLYYPISGYPEAYDCNSYEENVRYSRPKAYFPAQ